MSLKDNSSRLILEMRAMVAKFEPSDKLRWHWVKNKQDNIELRVIYRTPILDRLYHILFKFPANYPNYPPQIFIVKPVISIPEHNCSLAFRYPNNCAGCPNRRIRSGEPTTCIVGKIPHLYTDGSLCCFDPSRWNPAKHTAMWILEHTFEWILFYEVWLESLTGKSRRRIVEPEPRRGIKNSAGEKKRESFLKSIWKEIWS